MRLDAGSTSETRMLAPDFFAVAGPVASFDASEILFSVRKRKGAARCTASALKSLTRDQQADHVHQSSNKREFRHMHKQLVFVHS